MIDYQTKNHSDSIVVVELSGKLNESTRSNFFQYIKDVLGGNCTRVIVDCSKLGMLGSAGLAALLMARKHARKAGRRMYLTHVNSSFAEVLEKTKLNRHLAIFPSTGPLIDKIRTGGLVHT